MNKTQDTKLTTVCPVCNSTNSENAQYCINSKCGFTLKFSKQDRYFVDISESELNEYNEELKKAKQNYKQMQELICSVNLTKKEEKQHNMKKLSNLKRDKFESIADFQKRIEGLEFIQIGSYKLKEYNADKEHYVIEIKIEKQANQTLDYDFTKLEFIKIKKEEAKRLSSMGNQFPLFARLSLGFKAQVLDKIHTINKSSYKILEPIVDNIDFDENTYKIKALKFEGIDLEIQENTLIRMMKEHKIAILLAIGLVWMGI